MIVVSSVVRGPLVADFADIHLPRGRSLRLPSQRCINRSSARFNRGRARCISKAMATLFALKDPPTVPLEAEVISPDIVGALSRQEILHLPVFHGNRRRALGEFFDVIGEGGEELAVRGELSRVKSIGRGMTRGRVTIAGNVGMHLGAQMAGGEIVVDGDASDWVGAEMTGGRIRIRGHAGGQVGAAYRGSRVGMRGGTIIVEGSAGIEVGMRMRAGVIAVLGRVGDLAGAQMRGGTLFLFSPAGLRTGAWMERGTIVSFAPLELLPTFVYDCAFRPVFLRMYLRSLARLEVRIPAGTLDRPYRHYTGDFADLAKGEILLWDGATA